MKLDIYSALYTYIISSIIYEYIMYILLKGLKVDFIILTFIPAYLFWYVSTIVKTNRYILLSFMIVLLNVFISSYIIFMYINAIEPELITSVVTTSQQILTTHATVLSLSSEIFLNNIKIDLVSFVPVAGPMALSIDVLYSGAIIWSSGIAGVVATMSMLSSFTELFSYSISVAGSMLLYNVISTSIKNRTKIDFKQLKRPAIYLASSIILLYVSAVLEASWLIIR